MSELTPEQREELDTLKAALQEEYAASQANKTAQTAKQDLVDLKGDFLEALSYVTKHGTEANRLKVSMWGYDKLLEEGKADTDPIRKLLEGMPAPAAATDE